MIHKCIYTGIGSYAALCENMPGTGRHVITSTHSSWHYEVHIPHFFDHENARAWHT